MTSTKTTLQRNDRRLILLYSVVTYQALFRCTAKRDREDSELAKTRSRGLNHGAVVRCYTAGILQACVLVVDKLATVFNAFCCVLK